MEVSFALVGTQSLSRRRRRGNAGAPDPRGTGIHTISLARAWTADSRCVVRRLSTPSREGTEPPSRSVDMATEQLVMVPWQSTSRPGWTLASDAHRGPVFISYSRREFNFAESLAPHLTAAGVDA